VLETVALSAIGSKRYPFQVELRAWFRVVEMPFTFSERQLGPSTMRKAIFAEALWKVPLLRAPSGRL
jgi:hypothetical protein